MAAYPFERKEAVVIVNPAAHNAPKRERLAEAEEWLRLHGWKIEWLETRARGDATPMASRAAGRGVPLVFVCGGDGTLNEAVNGLAGSETAVAVIPAGVSNLWAREIGVPKKTLEAVRTAVHGDRRLVDLGRAGSRYFLLMAGYGIDASTIHGISWAVKDRVGAAAYALSSARQALTYRSSRVTLSLDGESRRLRMFLLVAGNTRLYAGITRITPEAVVDDGRLDVCVYEGRSRWDIIWLAVLTLLGQHGRSKKVTQRRVERIALAWEEPPLVQVDGDAMKESPAEVEIAPEALWVMTPKGLKTPLFRRKPE